MNYIVQPEEEASIQLTLDEVHGEGTYTVYTSIDGRGYDVHNSEGDWIDTFSTSVEVEDAYCR